jgi:hypothetical protein
MSSPTKSAFHDLKSGLKGIHGIGESIRGVFNGAIDHAVHDKTGEAKDRAVLNQGEAEMQQGRTVIDKNRTTGATAGTTVSPNTCMMRGLRLTREAAVKSTCSCSFPAHMGKQVW